jgi:hypothetical protein
MQEVGGHGCDPAQLQVLVECPLQVLIKVAAQDKDKVCYSISRAVLFFEQSEQFLISVFSLTQES